MVGWLSRLFSSKPVPVREPEPPAAIVAPEPEEAEPEIPLSSASQTAAFPRISWMQNDTLNANFMHWLFEGNDESDLFANQLEKEILAALEKIVSSNQAGSDLVRRMPGVIPQLMQSLRTDDFSGAELARR